jgi:hypothetical protein
MSVIKIRWSCLFACPEGFAADGDVRLAIYCIFEQYLRALSERAAFAVGSVGAVYRHSCLAWALGLAVAGVRSGEET